VTETYFDDLPAINTEGLRKTKKRQ